MQSGRKYLALRPLRQGIAAEKGLRVTEKHYVALHEMSFASP